MCTGKSSKNFGMELERKPPFPIFSHVSLYGSALFKFKRNGRFGACRAQLGLGVLGMGADSHGTFPSGFAAGVKKWEPEQNENKTGTCE